MVMGFLFFGSLLGIFLTGKIIFWQILGVTIFLMCFAALMRWLGGLGKKKGK